MSLLSLRERDLHLLNIGFFLLQSFLCKPQTSIAFRNLKKQNCSSFPGYILKFCVFRIIYLGLRCSRLNERSLRLHYGNTTLNRSAKTKNTNAGDRKSVV